jgi:apolipoprotein N-acyltransferase
VLAVASALLLWLSFPPAGQWRLTWIALAPLFLLVKSSRSRASLYSGSWLGGLVFWLLAIHWVRLTDPTAWLAWLVMALFLSLWWPAFLALARLAVLGLRVPLMIAAPILWVGLEYLRAHVLTGFPWYYLAHAQHAVLPVIQIADLTGALGVSWLIALVNAWWVDLLTLPLFRPTSKGPRLARPQVARLAAVAGLVVATLGYGSLRLGTSSFRDGPRLALLQSNLEQRIKMTTEPRVFHENEALFRRLTERAARQSPPPDLIVWPETAYPYPGFGVIDPLLDASGLERMAKELDPEGTAAFWRGRVDLLSRHLHGWTDEVKVPMLVGVVVHEFRPPGHSKYNSAVLFQPRVGAVQNYHKIHLVPFGEYVPLIDYFPWLTALTPYHGTRVPVLNFGKGPSWITLGPYRIATAICFEDSVPHVVRRFFSEVPDGHQPDLLINLSNDGWFHGSSEHDMHLAVSVFRAVENRVPLARAVNTGISAFIDGNGRVLKTLPKLSEGVLSDVVRLDDRVSCYSSWGDWLGLSCLAVTIGLIPLSFRRPVLNKRPS